MTQEEYISLQLSNIDKSLVLGRELLRASASLHRVCDDADQEASRKNTSRNYLLDSLQYFSFNDAAAELSGMPETLKDFKQSLIDIKIANDRMLLEGGYRKDIDESISRVFLSHTLCKIQIIDSKVLGAVKDALDTLENLKKELAG